MSRNILIVESENDKYFIEALIEHLKIPDNTINIDPPICSIDDYECLGGFSKSSLKKKLKGLEREIGRGYIEKIGIIIDADEIGIEERIKTINESLKVIDKDLNFTECNHFIKSEKLDVEIACYIMNIGGFGELETVLKTIKSHDSAYADCLYDWKKCLEKQNKLIKKKDFDKFWVNTYQRLDCCTKDEQKQANRKCNNEASMKKQIWDFEHTSLNKLKKFLKLFS